MDIEFSSTVANDLVESLEAMTRLLARQERNMAAVEEWMYGLEFRMAELSRLAAVARKASKPRKALPFVAGAVIGVYLYKKFLDLDIEVGKAEEPVVNISKNGSDPDADTSR